ncbi:MAG: nucleoside triphosphate pyrophosphohydrolase [Clostridiales bacterium]|nr:nucleoside triphosphate pyrophosphohydrolase [Clostridiales bacterium]
MKKNIVITPLSTPETITEAAKTAIFSADKLFLQTAVSPCARPVLDAGPAFTAMDDLYETCADFDALAGAIADRLTAGGSCVYAVCGGGCYAQLPVIRAKAKERGFALTILAGVSYAAAAFPEVQEGLRLTAAEPLPRLNPALDLTCEELHNPIAAAETKLALLEFYPPDWPVTLATLGESGRYSRAAFPLYALDQQPRYHAASVLFVPKADFDDLTRYGYDELVSVTARLRAPDGCHWDREQTHQSLKRSLLEECYELLDAIDEGDDAHLCEELGDVLLQVVLHAQIAAEQGRFNERDVADGLVKKLLYRHPHVFGDVKVSSTEEALRNWDALKRNEKGQTTVAASLESIPRSFPALVRCDKVQRKVGKAGFDWTSAQEAFHVLPDEVRELEEAMAQGSNIEEEMGDVFFSAVNIARLLGLDAEELLQKSTDKFVARYAKMEALAGREGLKIQEMPFSEQDKYWQRVKK